jgi:AcrR family transcriptional regulator
MQKDASTEERILMAARKIFLDKGLDGARMQDIADEAGINKAMLHYYFRNKDTLFETIFRSVAEEFMPRMFEIIGSSQPLFDKIQLFVEGYIRQCMKTPYVPMFILKEMNRDPQGFIHRVLKDKKPPVEVILPQIAAEVKAGRIKPVNPMSLLMNTLSLCVFPFLARPMLLEVVGISGEDFNQIMEQRIREIPQIIIQSIKS